MPEIVTPETPGGGMAFTKVCTAYKEKSANLSEVKRFKRAGGQENEWQTCRKLECMREKEEPLGNEYIVCNSQSKGATDTPAKNCLHTRLRVVPISLSPSSVMREKSVKKIAVRNPGGKKRAKGGTTK